MAILLATTSDYLTRNNSIPNWNDPSEFNNGAKFSGWFKFQALPTGSQYIPVWLFGDPNLIHPYLRVYVTSAGLVVKTYDGTTTKTSTATAIIPSNRWIYLYVAYDKSFQQILPAFIDRTLPTINSVQLHLFPWVEQQEWLGADNSGSSDRIAGLLAAHTRTSYRGFLPFIGGQNTSDVHAEMDEIGLNDYYLAGGTPTLVDVFKSSVGLFTSTDLADTTTHGNVWIVHGTLTNGSGPLALGGFSDNFDDGTFSPWTKNTNNKNAIAVGIAGSKAFSCADAEVRRMFEQPYPTEGTINLYHAVNWSTSPGTGELPNLILVGYAPSRSSFDTFLGNSLSTGFLITGEGKIKLSIGFTASGTIFSFSAANVILLDGTPYGIQFTWKLTGSSLTSEVYVNGVLVVTLTATIASLVFSYYNFVLLQSLLNNTSIKYWTASDNFQLVHTYRGLTPPINPTNMAKLGIIVCSVTLPPPPDLSGIYSIIPDKTHDSYNTAEKKIPDPTIKTAGMGE